MRLIFQILWSQVLFCALKLSKNLMTNLLTFPLQFRYNNNSWIMCIVECISRMNEFYIFSKSILSNQPRNVMLYPYFTKQYKPRKEQNLVKLNSLNLPKYSQSAWIVHLQTQCQRSFFGCIHKLSIYTMNESNFRSRRQYTNTNIAKFRIWIGWVCGEAITYSDAFICSVTTLWVSK